MALKIHDYPKNVFGSGLAFLLFASLCGCTPSVKTSTPQNSSPQEIQAQVEGHISTATNALQKRQLETAVSEWREAVRLKPEDALLHYNLGNLLRIQGNSDAALAEWREAVRIKPALAEAHANIGNVLDEKRDVEGAIAELREAVRLKPDLTEAYIGLSHSLSRKGVYSDFYRQAVLAALSAVRLQPSDARTYYNLGNLYYLRANTSKAWQAFRKAAHLQPDNLKYQFSWAGAALDFARYDDAATAYRLIVARQPNNAAAHFGLGKALSEQGQIEGAKSEWRKAANLNDKRVADEAKKLLAEYEKKKI